VAADRTRGRASRIGVVVLCRSLCIEEITRRDASVRPAWIRTRGFIYCSANHPWFGDFASGRRVAGFRTARCTRDSGSPMGGAMDPWTSRTRGGDDRSPTRRIVPAVSSGRGTSCSCRVDMAEGRAGRLPPFLRESVRAGPRDGPVISEQLGAPLDRRTVPKMIPRSRHPHGR